MPTIKIDKKPEIWDSEFCNDGKSGCKFASLFNRKCGYFGEKLELKNGKKYDLWDSKLIKCDECKKAWQKVNEKRKQKRVIRCNQCKKGPCLYEWNYNEGSDKYDEFTGDNDLVRHFGCPDEASPVWCERTLINKSYFDKE
jgi:hypothetical protein